MYSPGKQEEIADSRAPGIGNANGAERKKALEKLASYLRCERGYSDKQIRAFIAESFLENKDWWLSSVQLKTARQPKG